MGVSGLGGAFQQPPKHGRDKTVEISSTSLAKGANCGANLLSVSWAEPAKAPAEVEDGEETRRLGLVVNAALIDCG